jgi:hypothetical protein
MNPTTSAPHPVTCLPTNHAGVGHPGRCILHPLVFRVLPRCSRGNHTCRYNVVFVHSSVNTTTSSVRTRSCASLSTSPTHPTYPSRTAFYVTKQGFMPLLISRYHWKWPNTLNNGVELCPLWKGLWGLVEFMPSRWVCILSFNFVADQTSGGQHTDVHSWTVVPFDD